MAPLSLQPVPQTKVSKYCKVVLNAILQGRAVTMARTNSGTLVTWTGGDGCVDGEE